MCKIDNAGYEEDKRKGDAPCSDDGETAEKQQDTGHSDGADENEHGKSDLKSQDETQNDDSLDIMAKELETVKAQLTDKSKQCDEYFNMLQRTAAEFDNYRKRTAKEKEALYSDAVSDIVTAFLPVIDSIEKAIQTCMKEGSDASIKEGIELVDRKIKDVLKKLGVEEIKAIGENFDPELHEAIMHIEDKAYGKNVIVEEFLKGYIYKERVIRHSIVKVAN